MEPVRITLLGDPITKKNSMRIIMAGGRPRIIPSKQYQEYETACLWQISGKYRMIDKAVNVGCKYYLRTDRKVDLLNLLAATMDILVEAFVLADDNRKIVAQHDGCAVYVDKKNPRVEIEITEVRDELDGVQANETGCPV